MCNVASQHRIALQGPTKAKLAEAQHLSRLADQIGSSALAISQALEAMRAAAAIDATCTKLRQRVVDAAARTLASKQRALELQAEVVAKRAELEQARDRVIDLRSSDAGSEAIAKASMQVHRLEAALKDADSGMQAAQAAGAAAATDSIDAESTLRSVQLDAAASSETQSVVTRLLAAKLQAALRQNEAHEAVLAADSVATSAAAVREQATVLRQAAGTSEQRAWSLHAAGDADDALKSMAESVRCAQQAAESDATASAYDAQCVAHKQTAVRAVHSAAALAAQCKLLDEHCNALDRLHRAQRGALTARSGLPTAQRDSAAPMSTLQADVDQAGVLPADEPAWSLQQAAGLETAAECWRDLVTASEASCTALRHYQSLLQAKQAMPDSVMVHAGTASGSKSGSDPESISSASSSATDQTGCSATSAAAAASQQVQQAHNVLSLAEKQRSVQIRCALDADAVNEWLAAHRSAVAAVAEGRQRAEQLAADSQVRWHCQPSTLTHPLTILGPQKQCISKLKQAYLCCKHVYVKEHVRVAGSTSSCGGKHNWACAI